MPEAMRLRRTTEATASLSGSGWSMGERGLPSARWQPMYFTEALRLLPLWRLWVCCIRSISGEICRRQGFGSSICSLRRAFWCCPLFCPLVILWKMANQPVEGLFLDFGRRSGSQEADSFAQVLAAARRSGGELVEIIGHTAGIIRDKMQVQEEIHTMTASRVFEQKIMNAVPFGIVLYIDFTSPGFFRQMYGLWSGRVIMTLCLLLYGAAVALSRRILAIEV